MISWLYAWIYMYRYLKSSKQFSKGEGDFEKKKLCLYFIIVIRHEYI